MAIISSIRQGLGNAVDVVGTAARKAGIKGFENDKNWSELIAGNPTVNTGSAPVDRNSPLVQASYPQPTYGPEPAPSSQGTVRTAASAAGTASLPSGGGSSAPAVPDRSNEISFQNSRLAQLDPTVAAQLGQLQSDYDKIIGGYDTDVAKNEKLFGDMRNTNRSNLDRGLQSIYMNSANQLQGLNGVLASLGALSGTNVGQVGRLVQNASNQDIGDVNSTFRSNAGALQGEFDRFKDEDEKRRTSLSETLSNQEKSVNMDALTQRQTALNALSNLYAEIGDSGRANQFAEQARALDAQIAPLTVRSQALAPVAASFTPQALSNYSRGGTTTSIRSAGQTPQGVANLVALRGQDEEEREQA